MDNNNASKPTRHQLRRYLTRRHRSSKPPPKPEEIRRQLGWNLCNPDKPESGDR